LLAGFLQDWNRGHVSIVSDRAPGWQAPLDAEMAATVGLADQ
jgi:hypothetical protein